MRVVSLLPAATEVVCALGLENTLVGRSHECDYPPFVRALPAVTSSKLALDGTAYHIDQKVKALVGEGLSIYRVDADLLGRLRPDVIITQLSCEVCAASAHDVEAALAGWLGPRPRLLTLTPTALADVLADVWRIGEALGAGEAGRALAAGLRARLDALGARTAHLPRVRVACIEWTDPLMIAGNWVPELVALAGGEAILARAGAHSPWVEWEALRKADPDVIVVMPCGWDEARARAELGTLSTRPGWEELTAVRSNRVYGVDGNAYFNRPGPRLADSAELLAGLLHPDLAAAA